MSITIHKTILHAPSMLLVAAGAHFVDSVTASTNWAASTSASTPCTPDTALSNAVAGDVVYFRGGTYTLDYTGATYEIPAWNPTNQGTALSPITFIAYPGEIPIIPTKTWTDQVAFGSWNRDYIVWDGIQATMQNTSAGFDTSWLAVMMDADYCVIRNCDFIGVINGTPVSGGNNCFVRMDGTIGSKVHNNLMHGNIGAAGAVNTGAMYMFNVTNCDVYNNTIYDCTYGIQQKDGPNQNSRVYNNLIYDCYVYGIRFIEQFATTAPTMSAYDNLIIGSDSGIFMDGTSGAILNQHYQIYNNTIVNCDTGIEHVDYAGLDSIYNNIFYNCVVQQRIDGTYQPTLSDYNCYYRTSGSYVWWVDYSTSYSTIADWRTATPFDDNSFTSDPLFTVGTGAVPTNYTLGVSSPCRGTGRFGDNVGVRNLANIGAGIAQRSYNELFRENFNNSTLSGRSWYDMSATPVISTTQQDEGAGCIELAFALSANTPPVVALRKLFTPSNSIYMRARVKYSAGWQGSGGSDHPHEFYFLTTLNGDYDGLSDTFLTTYVEQNALIPQVGIQDARNIDETNIGVNLIGVTELRSVAGCNGLGGGNAQAEQQDCYEYSGPTDHRNDLFWKCDSALLGSSYHTVEAYFEMNTITASVANFDGKIRMWIDGVLQLSYNNIMFRTGNHSTQQFEQVIIAPYIGVGSPIAQTMYIDSFVLGSNLILDVLEQ